MAQGSKEDAVKSELGALGAAEAMGILCGWSALILLRKVYWNDFGLELTSAFASC